MKKILIVTEYFYPEEFKINEIALEWQKKGYEVAVLTNFPTYPEGKIFDGYENNWYKEDEYEGIKVYRVKSVTGYKESLFKKLLKYFIFMFVGSFVALKIGKKYDYVFGYDVGALTGMVPAVLLRKFYDKKVTLWIQDIWPDSVYAYGFRKTKLLGFFLDGLVSYVYKNTSNFAIPAKGFEKRIRPFLKNEKIIKYLPSWSDELNLNLEAFQFSKEEKIHFTFAGNIGKVQNLDNIIDAFGSLGHTTEKKIQLNIIGDGSYLEFLKKKVEKNHYINIVFWGRQPREEMFKYFSGSDFLIISLIDKPIFSLTIPGKTQTYIASSKPILGFIKGETADIIKENDLGFVASPEDVEAMKEVFIKAITLSKDEQISLTKRCEDLTKTVFNKQVIVDSLLKLMLEGR